MILILILTLVIILIAYILAILELGGIAQKHNIKPRYNIGILGTPFLQGLIILIDIVGASHLTKEIKEEEKEVNLTEEKKEKVIKVNLTEEEVQTKILGIAYDHSLEENKGVVIHDLKNGSSCHKFGLKVNDLIIKLNHYDVKNIMDLQNIVKRNQDEGNSVYNFVVLR